MFAGIRWNPYCGGRRTGYLNSMGMDSSSLIMLILPAPVVILQVLDNSFSILQSLEILNTNLLSPREKPL
jgi:hypothetical protein